jgi:hypothetical protein
VGMAPVSLVLLLLLALSASVQAQSPAASGVSRFRFSGYLFFYGPDGVERFRLEYLGLVTHPVAFDDNGTWVGLVYNCTGGGEEGLLRVYRFTLEGRRFEVFVYNTRCWLSYPILYLVNGTAEAAGSRVRVAMNYTLIYSKGLRLRPSIEWGAPPNITAVERLVREFHRVIYLLIYKLVPAGGAVASASGTISFTAGPSNSTLIVEAPPNPCEARGSPLPLGGLDLWLDYVPQATPLGGLVCVAAEPGVLESIARGAEGALWSGLGDVVVESNSELTRLFGINGHSTRLLRELEGMNNTVLPADTRIHKGPSLRGSPAPQLIPARFGELAKRYLACYGPGGLPNNYMAPILVLPRSLSSIFGVEGNPLLLVSLDYQEDSPGYYSVRSCGQAPWRLIAYLALAGVAGAALVAAAQRVRGG